MRRLSFSGNPVGRRSPYCNLIRSSDHGRRKPVDHGCLVMYSQSTNVSAVTSVRTEETFSTYYLSNSRTETHNNERVSLQKNAPRNIFFSKTGLLPSSFDKRTKGKKKKQNIRPNVFRHSYKIIVRPRTEGNITNRRVRNTRIFHKRSARLRLRRRMVAKGVTANCAAVYCGLCGESAPVRTAVCPRVQSGRWVAGLMNNATDSNASGAN